MKKIYQVIELNRIYNHETIRGAFTDWRKAYDYAIEVAKSAISPTVQPNFTREQIKGRFDS